MNCPLCRSQRTDLDYHHWCYEPDVGCRLCRQCHKKIHGGERVREQKVTAESRGYYDWVYDALENLAVVEFEHHPDCRVVDRRSESVTVKTPFVDGGVGFRDHLISRYNIPVGYHHDGQPLPKQYVWLNTEEVLWGRGINWLGNAYAEIRSQFSEKAYDVRKEAEVVCTPRYKDK